MLAYFSLCGPLPSCLPLKADTQLPVGGHVCPVTECDCNEPSQGRTYAQFSCRLTCTVQHLPWGTRSRTRCTVFTGLVQWKCLFLKAERLSFRFEHFSSVPAMSFEIAFSGMLMYNTAALAWHCLFFYCEERDLRTASEAQFTFASCVGGLKKAEYTG